MKKLLGFAAVLAVLGAGFAYFAWNWAQGPSGSGGDPVEVTIAQGSSAGRIADTLEEHRVVNSALAFRLYMRLNGIDADLRAGDYELAVAQPFGALIDELRRGPRPDFVRLTIPEGRNVAQTAELVERQTHITENDFLAAATPETIRPAMLPADQDTLEGFLYPTTYFVEETETAETLVRRMVAEFDRHAEEVGLTEPNEFGLSAYQMLVLASLVEKEAKAAEERDVISKVIHNRLEINMALGIDATIQYAVNKYQGEPLTVSDLNIDSPFNSRTRLGLPPHPIASPRASSVEAALRPAEVDFLYFVLSPDCRSHVFSVSYSEFLAAKANQPTNC